MDIEALVQMFRQFYLDRDKEIHSLYDRSLPFGDTLLGNRWERAETLGFGAGSSIYDSAIVYGDVHVGEKTWIGPHVILDGSGGQLKIGAYCSISAGVHIYTHDTVMWALSKGVKSPDKGNVAIGDCCHIGAQSIIKAGVIIGRQCVVGANSFVNEKVPDCTIVGGSPARLLGHVTEQDGAIRLVFE